MVSFPQKVISPSAPFSTQSRPGKCADGSVSKRKPRTSLDALSLGHSPGRCADDKANSVSIDTPTETSEVYTVAAPVKVLYQEPKFDAFRSYQLVFGAKLQATSLGAFPPAHSPDRCTNGSVSFQNEMSHDAFSTRSRPGSCADGSVSPHLNLPLDTVNSGRCPSMSAE